MVLSPDKKFGGKEGVGSVDNLPSGLGKAVLAIMLLLRVVMSAEALASDPTVSAISAPSKTVQKEDPSWNWCTRYFEWDRKALVDGRTEKIKILLMQL